MVCKGEQCAPSAACAVAACSALGSCEVAVSEVAEVAASAAYKASASASAAYAVDMGRKASEGALHVAGTQRARSEERPARVRDQAVTGGACSWCYLLLQRPDLPCWVPRGCCRGNLELRHACRYYSHPSPHSHCHSH